MKLVKSAGMISNAGGQNYDTDPIVVSLEEKELLIMAYFGDRKTGPLQCWKPTSKGLSAISSKNIRG